MSQPLLDVSHLWKKYCRDLRRSLWYGVHDIADEILCRNRRGDALRPSEFWVTRDVSLELGRGQTLGIMGQNGAGKSTLLRLIYGLIKPDQGRVEVRGRASGMGGLGSGFKQILTGRENIYLIAAIWGLRRRHVDRLLHKIADFAELAEFLDTPVQSYSTGMKLRLAFAVALHVNPDLMLIDDILSVTDVAFQHRCLDRLAEFRVSGGTLIFVSHDSWAVEKLCDRVMVLDHGRVIDEGRAAEMIRRYESRLLAPAHDGAASLSQRAGTSHVEPIRR